MTRPFACRVFAASAACLFYLAALGHAAAPAPPYQIWLRTRGSVVTPERIKQSQTGGGYIQVTQVTPNAVMIHMRGAAATTANCKDGSAAMQFDLNQDFEIVATRDGLHPPRLSVTAWLIGALNSHDKQGGSAEQRLGCAVVQSAGQPLLNVCVKPHSVASGQNLLVNDRVGPMEMPVVPGGYCLHQTFALSVNQSKSHCRPGYASADFDPDPRLDPQWGTVLKPFRAVPHQDFGFHVLLRVVEDNEAMVPPATLPPPKLEKKKAKTGEGEAE